jgi:hypothetical protein
MVSKTTLRMVEALQFDSLPGLIELLPLDALSLGMRCESTIMFQKANTRVWNGKI